MFMTIQWIGLMIFISVWTERLEEKFIGVHRCLRAEFSPLNHWEFNGYQRVKSVWKGYKLVHVVIKEMTVNYPNQKQVSYGISKGVSVGTFPLHGVRDQLRAGLWCDGECFQSMGRGEQEWGSCWLLAHNSSIHGPHGKTHVPMTSSM